MEKRKCVSVLQKKCYRLLSIFLVFISFCSYCEFEFDSRYSTIRVSSGATFFLSNPISNFDGTLIKESGATITGSNITFAEGIIEDSGNSILLSGVFDPSGTIYLTGTDTFRAEPGKILQSISVSGSNNRLEGQPILQNDITMQDGSTTLILAVSNDLNKNIILNGGTLELENDLSFASDSNISGSGVIVGNGYKLSTGSELSTWSSEITFSNGINVDMHSPSVNFTGSLIFTDTSKMSGNGNIFDLALGGTITVGSGATLYLSDVVMKGLGSGGGSIVFGDDSSKLRMSNVIVELVGNVSTTQGDIYVDGTSTWILKDNTWTIDSSGKLTVDGVVLWKEPAGAITPGDISFGAPESNYLSLVESGTIVGQDMFALAAAGGKFQEQIDELKTSTGELQDQIDVLGTSTEELRSLIDGLCEECSETLQDQIDALNTSTGELRSLIDVNADLLTEHESEIDVLGTSTEELRSLIDGICDECAGSLQDQIDALNTSTGELRSLIDINADLLVEHESEIDVLGTSTEELRSLIDGICDECTGSLQEQIDELKTSTGELRSLIDGICDECAGSLQDQIDSLNTTTVELRSLIDVNADSISDIEISLEKCSTILCRHARIIQCILCRIQQFKKQTDSPVYVGELATLVDTNADQLDDYLASLMSYEIDMDSLATSTKELKSLLDVLVQADPNELQNQINNVKIELDDVSVPKGFDVSAFFVAIVNFLQTR